MLHTPHNPRTHFALAEIMNVESLAALWSMPGEAVNVLYGYFTKYVYECCVFS